MTKPTHYITLEHTPAQNGGVGVAMVAKEPLVNLALRAAGGGYTTEQTARAMVIRGEMEAGTWRRSSGENATWAIARVA